MKIFIPNSAFLGNINPFLRGFVPKSGEKLEIGANEKWIAVHPVVLVMVAALGLPLKAEQVFFEKLTARSAHYLERMGLFKFLGIDSGIKIIEHESAGRFIPLTQIRNSQELSGFITEIVPLLHLNPLQTDALRYVISELVRNVIEHADSPVGAIVAAQYYSKNNTIRIGISDTGVGIKSTINRHHFAKSNLAAIQLALTPGITGTTSREGGTESNAGAGLFFIKSIAKVSREFFVIYSGDALYKLLKEPIGKSKKLFADPFKDKHSSEESLPVWQGTVVGVDISLNDTQEFSDLLDLIREVYSKTVRERKREKYRKPKFI
ncbi:MAG: ATP-binding protein [Candidatus Moranbacteria bacterium]|nr:ATP-binding protein [Candidatus Moranbacteria bacterium]